MAYRATVFISKHDGMQIDPATRVVRGPEGSARLTPREYELIECLQAHEGSAVSRTVLLEDAWGWDHAADLKTKTVEMHVKRLRAKLSQVGLSPAAIETVRGVGYRLNAHS